MQKTFLAFIGGSGLYDLPGIQNVTEEKVTTPFGEPSDTIIKGFINDRPIAFLPRHGRGHRFLPTEVNYRANIYALKKLGVTHIISICAVGGLQEHAAPGTAIIPKQIADHTVGTRARTFFGNGIVGHISFADPFCPELQQYIHNACQQEDLAVTLGGIYVCIEGPRFSTRAESIQFNRNNYAVVGMTAMPEAILAREAEMAYATLAFVTDYDSWKENEAPVSVEAVLKVLQTNSQNAKKVALRIHNALPLESDNPVFSAAKFAIMTNPNLVPAATKENLKLFYGKYW